MLCLTIWNEHKLAYRLDVDIIRKSDIERPCDDEISHARHSVLSVSVTPFLVSVLS